MMMTKLLIDENVNQKAIKFVPFARKGLDVLLPEQGSYKGQSDRWIEKLAESGGRVIVTCDRDFSVTGVPISRMSDGLLWFRPSRLRSDLFEQTIRRFCKFLLSEYPAHPYEFAGKFFEIHEDHVIVRSAVGELTYELKD
jgi:predicted nuclease of predicted toxin-antitoxin system